MDETAKKMRKIADELICCMLQAGADDIAFRLQRQESKYLLRLESGYLPEHRKQMQDLERFLTTSEKDAGIEDLYWGLAGVSGLGRDSELLLIGQMIDEAKVEIGEKQVRLVLTKYCD